MRARVRLVALSIIAEAVSFGLAANENARFSGNCGAPNTPVWPSVLASLVAIVAAVSIIIKVGRGTTSHKVAAWVFLVVIVLASLLSWVIASFQICF